MSQKAFGFGFGEWTRARITTLVFAIGIVVLSNVHGRVTGQARAYVEVAQSSAFVALVLAVVWYVSRRDEFIRRSWSLAAVFGFVVGVIGLSVLDALRAGGIYHGAMGNSKRIFTWPFAAALVFFTWRYRWSQYDE
jgi:hypothetical protein